jgi:hypothetical protein
MRQAPSKGYRGVEALRFPKIDDIREREAGSTGCGR